MATAFDILGVIFGALSLLGVLRTTYRWLMRRLPTAKLDELDRAREETRKWMKKLQRDNCFHGEAQDSARRKTRLQESRTGWTRCADRRL
ncbi:hypothetical protein BD413DRAFT_617439 [Trametes elegans]|nr:hypothetical protein BD413DRAFT_617439 [Trametes elegans]